MNKHELRSVSCTNEHEQRLCSLVYVRERSIIYSFVFVHLKIFLYCIFILLALVFKI
ncbi:hypothetical protein HanRHA438_Chr02g0096021 [Helianthus annuus]|nr:hypothetical protein HanRHA438_Chr02g0096021 [Helianthus annuus]